MNFVVVKPEWIDVDDYTPENSKFVYYAVTLEFITDNHREIADEYWRYYNNRWEMLHEGSWKPLTNKHWKVVAYTEIITLEAYKN